MKWLFASLLLLLAGCPQTKYPGRFLNVTAAYKFDRKSARKTPKGILVQGTGAAILIDIDKKVDELESCLMANGHLKQKIRRGWIAVLVPPDWYVSKCSGQQLIPSRINYKLCEIKGLKITTQCRKVWKPTAACPCPCNARAAILNNWIIVTTPNLKLLKAELARIVLWPKYNNPWVKPINSCLR